MSKLTKRSVDTGEDVARRISEEGRQLRKKDRSMKAITQLLKSPPRRQGKGQYVVKYPGRNLGRPRSVKKVAEDPKPEISEKLIKPLQDEPVIKTDGEYHPDITKRETTGKKITLKPKHQMKVVARTNKRKLNTPHKGIFFSEHSKHNLEEEEGNIETEVGKEKISLNSELTMADFIRLAEETDCLDDEDLIEILTCPSPVWWEDPPNEDYTEEPIIVRLPKRKETSDNKCTETKTDHETLDIVVKISDKRIADKRSKLEKILGNIKNKIDSYNHESTNNNETTFVDRQDSVKNERIKLYSVNSECDETLSDIYVNGEELLKDLENMDIPIEAEEKNDVDQAESSTDSANIVKIKLIDRKDAAVNDNRVPETMSPLKRSPLNSSAESIEVDTAVEDITNNVESEPQNEENGVTVSTASETLNDLDKSNFITVYKIMSTVNAKEDHKVNQSIGINAFYKKRKSSGKINKDAKKLKTDGFKCDFCRRNTFVAIPDSNKKLCLRCSSIYEDNCVLCEPDGKKFGHCTCTESPKVMYSCKSCKFTVKSLAEIRTHVQLMHEKTAQDPCSWEKCIIDET